MVQRQLVTSGFDTETVVSERYLTYLLLAQIEAGLLETRLSVVDPASGVDIDVVLHPPVDYDRRYQPDPAAPLPEPVDGSFAVTLLPDRSSPPSALAWHPDGTRLAAGAYDGTVRLWDVEARNEVVVTDPGPSVAGADYSPDGSQLATAHSDGHVRLRDAQTGAVNTDIDAHQGGPALGAVFHPDGDRIASFGADGAVRLWDAGTGAELATMAEPGTVVLCAAFDAAGARLVTGSLSGVARVWDVATAAVLATVVEGDVAVTAVDLHPDGSEVACGLRTGAVRRIAVDTGDALAQLTGHTREVTGVAYLGDGARIATTSQDRTARTWSTADGSPMATFADHRRPVLSVAPHPAGHVATGARDGTVRLWDPSDGRQVGALRVPFLQILVRATITDNVSGTVHARTEAGLVAALEVEADETADGFEANHALRLSFLRFDPVTSALLRTVVDDVPAVEEELRARLDRALPLGVAQGQPVHRIHMHKFDRSVGFYVNLALRSGPEPDAFVPDRGDPALAQDFRSDDSPLAFATATGLYPLLGADLKFRQAEETSPGSGTYRYPLRETPGDPTAETIGRIKSVTVGPELHAGNFGSEEPTGALQVDIHGEYTDAPGDPDFSLLLALDPTIDAGLVLWDLRVDVDLGLFATLLLVVAGIIVALFIPWGSPLIVGTLLGLAVLKEHVAEPLAARMVAERLDEDAQASVVDALPFRVPAATRRWDPCYVTRHDVVALVDDVTVDGQGIAFDATGLTLGRTPVPVGHVVIRDEERATDGAVTALRYRVRDIGAVVPTDVVAPATDRMPYTRSDPDGEPTLVSIELGQVVERMSTDRLLAPISYHATMIHVVGNQIDHLLCISSRERVEQRDAVIRDFRDLTADEIRADRGDEIRDAATAELEAQLGRPPTDEEIDHEIDRTIAALVDEAQATFVEDDLPAALDAAVARVLRFDLAPEELIALQRQGVLLVQDVVIVTRHNADGTETDYYRDYADGDPRDNLLALPRYVSPYQPPA